MPGFHVVTSSYFIKSFHGLGKTKGLNLLRKNGLFSDTFILLSEEANLNERIIKVIERFICEFYGKRNTAELNDARHQMFCWERKSLNSEQIPPIRDSFMFLRRASYVTYLAASPHLLFRETCFANRCQCYRHQLTCSDVCGCQNCSNQFEGDWDAITDSDTDDESGAE